MDAVEILLMALVGLSILVFLILDYLDPPKQNAGEELIDDWVGVERSQVEKIFGEAIAFVNSNKINIGQDVKMELYGLQKLVFIGPCYKSQPLPLNFSARSKWKAWHKLGNMSEEMAMEKYIGILSETVPNWNIKENFCDPKRVEVIQGGEDEG